MALIGNITIGMRATYRLLNQDLGKASGALGRFASRANRLAGGAMDRLGAAAAATATGGIGAVAAATGYAIKAAGDFESNLIDVAKISGWTGEESRASVEAVSDEIRRMATSAEMAGTDFQTLFDVAKGAARMGFAAGGPGELMEFTQAIGMAAMSVDDMDPGELSEKVGQLMKVFRLSTDQALNVASTFDWLSDNAATTTSSIADLTQRMAPMAKIAGISFHDTAALAAALLDVGERSESTATAMQKILGLMYTRPDAFAKLLGQTNAQYKALAKNDPFGQLKAVAGALGKKPELFDMIPELKELDIKGTRAQQAMFQLTGQLESLGKLQAGASAQMQTGSHILNSVAANAGKTWSQLQRLWNIVKDTAAEFGQHLLPVIKGASQGFGMLSEDLRGLFERAGPALSAFGEGLAERVRSIGVLATHWDDVWELLVVTVEEKGLQVLTVFERLGPVLVGLFKQIGLSAGVAMWNGLQDLWTGDHSNMISRQFASLLGMDGATMSAPGVSLSRAMSDAGLGDTGLFGGLPDRNDEQAAIQARINAAIAARTATPAASPGAAAAPTPGLPGSQTARAVGAALGTGDLKGAFAALAEGVKGGIAAAMEAPGAAAELAAGEDGDGETGRGGHAAALEMGSVEARRAVLGHMLGPDPDETTARNTTEMAAEGRRQTQLLERVVDGLGDLATAVDF